MSYAIYGEQQLTMAPCLCCPCVSCFYFISSYLERQIVECNIFSFNLSTLSDFLKHKYKRVSSHFFVWPPSLLFSAVYTHTFLSYSTPSSLPHSGFCFHCSVMQNTENWRKVGGNLSIDSCNPSNPTQSCAHALYSLFWFMSTGENDVMDTKQQHHHAVSKLCSFSRTRIYY